MARALMQQPDVVLADEPTGNLDTHTGDGLFGLMRELNKARGTTFIIVTHNDKLSAQSDRIVHMQDGLIVEPLTPQRLIIRLRLHSSVPNLSSSRRGRSVCHTIRRALLASCCDHELRFRHRRWRLSLRWWALALPAWAGPAWRSRRMPWRPIGIRPVSQ